MKNFNIGKYLHTLEQGVMGFMMGLGLMVLSANSQAELTVVVDGMPKGGKAYVDFDEVGKAGNMAYYTLLFSFVEPDRNEVYSYTQYIKVNCDTLQEKVLILSAYKLPKAQGEPLMVKHFPDPEWEGADYDGDHFKNIRSKVCNNT